MLKIGLDKTNSWGWFHQYVYDQLLHVQTPEVQKDSQDVSVSLHFWDLWMQNLHVKYWWNWPLFIIYCPIIFLNSWKLIFPSPSRSAAETISSISWLETLTGKLLMINFSSSTQIMPSLSQSNLKENRIWKNFQIICYWFWVFY